MFGKSLKPKYIFKEIAMFNTIQFVKVWECVFHCTQAIYVIVVDVAGFRNDWVPNVYHLTEIRWLKY